MKNKCRLFVILSIAIVLFLYMAGMIELSKEVEISFMAATLILNIRASIDTFAK